MVMWGTKFVYRYRNRNIYWGERKLNRIHTGNNTVGVADWKWNLLPCTDFTSVSFFNPSLLKSSWSTTDRIEMLSMVTFNCKIRYFILNDIFASCMELSSREHAVVKNALDWYYRNIHWLDITWIYVETIGET